MYVNGVQAEQIISRSKRMPAFGQGSADRKHIGLLEYMLFELKHCFITVCINPHFLSFPKGDAINTIPFHESPVKKINKIKLDNAVKKGFKDNKEEEAATHQDTLKARFCISLFFLSFG